MKQTVQASSFMTPPLAPYTLCEQFGFLMTPECGKHVFAWGPMHSAFPSDICMASSLSPSVFIAISLSQPSLPGCPPKTAFSLPQNNSSHDSLFFSIKEPFFMWYLVQYTMHFIYLSCYIPLPLECKLCKVRGIVSVLIFAFSPGSIIISGNNKVCNKYLINEVMSCNLGQC